MVERKRSKQPVENDDTDTTVEYDDKIELSQQPTPNQEDCIDCTVYADTPLTVKTASW